MKKVVFLIIVLSSILPISAQTNGKLWCTIEVGTGYSFSDKDDNYGISYAHSNSMSVGQAVLGYYILPKLSIGAGIGINGYSNPGLNTIPLFIDIRYHPFTNKSCVFNGSFGYPIATNECYIDAKSTMSLSFGYILFKTKKFKVTPSIGYNYCSYSVTDSNDWKHNTHRNSLFAKIGVAY